MPTELLNDQSGRRYRRHSSTKLLWGLDFFDDDSDDESKTEREESIPTTIPKNHRTLQSTAHDPEGKTLPTQDHNLRSYVNESNGTFRRTSDVSLGISNFEIWWEYGELAPLGKENKAISSSSRLLWGEELLQGSTEVDAGEMDIHAPVALSTPTSHSSDVSMEITQKTLNNLSSRLLRRKDMMK